MPNFNIYFKIKCKVSTKKFRGKKIKNKKSLPSAKFNTRQRAPLPSAESNDTRQRLTVCTTVSLCRVPRFAECLALGKETLCRVSDCAECQALGKESLCRVPCFAECGSRLRGSLPSARVLALGKAYDTRQSSAKFGFSVVYVGRAARRRMSTYRCSPCS